MADSKFRLLKWEGDIGRRGRHHSEKKGIPAFLAPSSVFWWQYHDSHEDIEKLPYVLPAPKTSLRSLPFHSAITKTANHIAVAFIVLEIVTARYDECKGQECKLLFSGNFPSSSIKYGQLLINCNVLDECQFSDKKNEILIFGIC